MRRICCGCKTIYGEKCGVCGSSNLAIESYAETHPEIFADIPMASRRELFKEYDRFLCLDCGEMRPRGFGGDSHGYCIPCRDKSLAEIVVRQSNGNPEILPLRGNRLRSAWFRLAMLADRAWAWFQNFGIGK